MRAAVLAALAALPLGALAENLQLAGDLTGGYSRSDSGGDAAPRSTATTWDWGTRLSLSGSPFRPGLADFVLAGDYRDVHSLYDTGDTRTQVLGLRAETALLGNSIVPMHLGLSRTYTEFATDAGTDRTGRSIATSGVASVVLRPRDYPMLTASVTRNDVDTRPPGGAPFTTDSTRLALGASQVAGDHQYSIAYDTGWDEGTYAQSNYRSHNLLLDYSGAMGGTVLRFTDRYYLRAPTVADPTNPRLDDSTVSAGVQWRLARGGSASFDYTFRDATLAAPGGTQLSTVAHTAVQRVLVPVGSEISVQGQLEVGSGVERRDGELRRANDQSLGGSLAWHHVGPLTSSYAGAGLSVGVVEPSDHAPETSFGATGSYGVTWTQLPFAPTATYLLTYQHQSAQLSGWSLQNRLDLSGQGAITRRVFGRAILTLSDALRDDALLGTSEVRSATLLVSAWGMRTTAQVTLGVTDSLGQGIAPPGQTEGFVAPRQFNTRSTYATLTATRLLWDGHVTLSGMLRTLATTAPDRPEQWEQGAYVDLGLNVGLLVLSLNDQASRSGVGGTSRFANLIMVRVTRSFGARLR